MSLPKLDTELCSGPDDEPEWLAERRADNFTQEELQVAPPNLLPAVASGPPALDVVHNVDALTLLRALPDCSIDSVVTDPPAGIAFMGKEWDRDKGGRAAWVAWMTEIAAECLRVLKPGGHALVWAIPRTSHWTGWAWEDAGFVPRDKTYHLFGSGFPKSHNISAAIDKEAGAEREVIRPRTYELRDNGGYSGGLNTTKPRSQSAAITAPATDAAKQWAGWGSALKPAAEEWWLFRKPLTGTLAQNVQQWGTGGLNVDACRIRVEDDDPNHRRNGSVSIHEAQKQGIFGVSGRNPANNYNSLSDKGRWPANVTHDGSAEVLALFPESEGGAFPAQRTPNAIYGGGKGASIEQKGGARAMSDSGSAARFFYTAKASSSERGAHNTHPTVKPLALMEWLIKLVTPPGGIVLDPFAGSGTTCLAAKRLGFHYIACDMNAEYVQIARLRIDGTGIDHLNAKDAAPLDDLPLFSMEDSA